MVHSYALDLSLKVVVRRRVGVEGRRRQPRSPQILYVIV
jgi:hypothetical protein